MVNILHLVLAVCLEKSVQHGSNPSFPYLNKQHTLYATLLCGRDTVQYDNDKISQKWYVNFLSNITLIIEKQIYDNV